MKKIFFAAILCFLATAKTVAQDIYNEIRNKSNAAAHRRDDKTYKSI